MIARFIFILLLILVGSTSAMSQISGVINTYAKVTVIDETCNSVQVTSSSGFAVGDKVLIIQMKGAQINQTNTASFGNLTGTGLGNAGNYEINEIAAIDGMILYFKYKLIRTYDPSQKVQLVRIPVYDDVTVTGTLTADSWNGDIGGVLIFESTGVVTMNADMDVSGQGFLGGDCSLSGEDCAYFQDGPYFTAAPTTKSGRKGEGAAAFITGMEAGRGKQLNGGGGGINLNTGGAGGANYGNGGNGGKTSSGCGSLASSNFGLGGLGFTTSIESQNKIFLGGGGGGGHQDNGLCNPGGNGGGIIIVTAVSIEGNGHSILALGNSVSEHLSDHGDGNGGGGAGGSILLNGTVLSSFISTPPTINVSGGKGGNTNDQNSPGKNFGPGGGGGGGVIWLKSAAVPVAPLTIDGGLPGNSRACACSHGAVKGDNGKVALNLSIPISNPISDGVCYSTTPVDLLQYEVQKEGKKANLQWVTIMETNNSFFTIERSEDGIHFYEIGKVQATNSRGRSDYAYTDKAPGDGTIYYRLSQTDADGKANVLGIRTVKFDVSQRLIQSIYPNPFNQSVSLRLNPVISELEISIIDITGRLLFSKNINDNTGNITIQPELPAGPYFLLVRNNNTQEEKYLVIKE